MSCLTPSRESAYLRTLNCQVRRVNCLMDAWDRILRNHPTAPTTFAALLSVTFPDPSSEEQLEIDSWIGSTFWLVGPTEITLGRDGGGLPILTGGSGTDTATKTFADLPAGPYRLTLNVPNLLGDAGVTSLVVRVIVNGTVKYILSAPDTALVIDFYHPGGQCVIELEAQWVGDGEIYAVITETSLTTNPDALLPVTLLWESSPDYVYQVQESPDGVAWFIASYAVPGNPQTTTWVSGQNYPEGEQPFFRILQLPRGVICCSLPEVENPPRFTAAIIGPTGGNAYGGCSDCAGNFPVCDDPLWNLT